MTAATTQAQPTASGAEQMAAERAHLLTAEDLAERWQVPSSHVYRLTRSGRLPAVKLGRYYRYRLDAIEHFEAPGGAGTDA